MIPFPRVPAFRRRTPLPLPAAVVLAVVLATSSIAHANDPAAAQSLFDEATALSTKEQWAAACPKFEESQRLDPGMGTQYRLAQCYEHVGRLASAWANYIEVADVALVRNQTDREQVARAAAKALEPRLSYLTIVVVGDRGPGFRVTRDGDTVGQAQWGSRVPVDAGAHAIEASEPGKRTWKLVAQVQGEGQTATVTIGPLEQHAKPNEASSLGGQRTVALVVGGAGLVALGVGSYFGFAALSNKADSNSNGHCAGNVCDSAGLSLRSDAVSKGNVSSVLLGAGVLAIGAGVVLWLTAPSRQVPTVGFDGHRLLIRGVF